MENNDNFFLAEGKSLKNYIIKGLSEKVIEEVNRLIECSPEKSSLLYYMLAEHYYFKSDGEKNLIYKAIATYEKLINLKDADRHYVMLAVINLALAFQAVNEREKSMQYFDKAFNEYPELFEKNSELQQKMLNCYNDLKNNLTDH